MLKTGLMQVDIKEVEMECKLTQVKCKSTAFLPYQDSYKREGERNGVRDRLKMPNPTQIYSK